MITTDFLIMPFRFGIPKANNGIANDAYSIQTKEIEYCIDLYERNYLNGVLGEELYAEYISDMADETLALKWADFNAKLIVDSKSFISPIANYIFYHYITRNAVAYIGGRFEISKVDGSNVMSTEEQKNMIWNAMVEMNQKFFIWFLENLPDTTAQLDYVKWDYLTTPKFTHLCY